MCVIFYLMDMQWLLATIPKLMMRLGLSQRLRQGLQHRLIRSWSKFKDLFKIRSPNFCQKLSRKSVLEFLLTIFNNLGVVLKTSKNDVLLIMIKVSLAYRWSFPSRKEEIQHVQFHEQNFFFSFVSNARGFKSWNSYSPLWGCNSMVWFVPILSWSTNWREIVNDLVFALALPNTRI